MNWRVVFRLAAILAALVLPASASAAIYPLSVGSTTQGLATYEGAAPVPAPFVASSLGFVGDASLGAAPFRVTVAWNSGSDNVLVGCRGRGSADVSVRVGRVTNWTSCRNLTKWRVEGHATPKQHVYATTDVYYLPAP